MSKRLFAVIAVLMVSSLCWTAMAVSEHDVYRTHEDDLYYHSFTGCLGRAQPISLSEAELLTAGKAPCPVCMPVSDKTTEIRAAERGGTIVLRIPDGWVDGFFVGRESFEPDENNTIPIEHFNRTGILTAAQILNGDDYIGFMNDWKNGNAEAVSISADSYAWRGNTDNLSMNLRHINGAWYDVTHAFGGDGDDWNLSFSANATKVWTEGDVLLTQYCDSDSEDALIPVESMKGAKPVFAAGYDNLTISIYDAMETHIAVFHEPDGNSDVLKDVGLNIGAHMTDILMNGYMNGKTAVFCCVLTDAEVAALESGAIPKLVRPSLADGADFMGTPYAVAHTDGFRYGIINTSGEWVVDPVYRLIDHDHPNFAQKHFLCWSDAGKTDNLTILDGLTLESLFSLKSVDSFGSGMENPLLLRVYSNGDGYNPAFYSLETGEKLFSKRDFYDGESDVNGRYAELADGYPRRIVISNEKAYKGAYLADDHGNPVTGEYDYIIPLVWTQGKGLFLTEKFSGWRGWVGSYIPGEKYDGRYVYGMDDYMCGLMDEDGNIIADIEYVAIEFVSIDEIRMIRADETFVTITPADWM